MLYVAFLSLAWLGTPIAAQVQFVPGYVVLSCILPKVVRVEASSDKLL